MHNQNEAWVSVVVLFVTSNLIGQNKIGNWEFVVGSAGQLYSYIHIHKGFKISQVSQLIKLFEQKKKVKTIRLIKKFFKKIIIRKNNNSELVIGSVEHFFPFSVNLPTLIQFSSCNHPVPHS